MTQQFALLLACLAAVSAASADWLPLSCKAHRTVGMHDDAENVEAYESVVFFESEFDLRENTLFMQHLLGRNTQVPVSLYMTMTLASGTEIEFECKPVRGAADSEGFSCANNPPSEMLLINPDRGRFTRSAIGGWTFYSAGDASNGASLFVEYGECVRQTSQPEAQSDAPP